MIGWYIHHHGFGHVARFLAVQPHLSEPVIALSSMPRPDGLGSEEEWVVLPPDADAFEAADGTRVDPRDADPTVRGRLHWAPIGHPWHRRRLATIATIAAERALDGFVVDVSAEVVAFARLLGLRTVAVTQPGMRTDPAHVLAYDLADRIIAPWTQGAVPSPGLDPHVERVTWTGGISRFDGRPAPDRVDERHVLFLGRVLPPDVREASVRLLTERGWTVTSVGHDDASRVDDPWQLLTRCTVVVTAAGQNSVADVAASGARCVVIAQDRPFDEQRATAEALARWGLARRADDDISPTELADLVERAADDTPEWARWRTAGAARRMAAAIQGTAP
ncbi:MULTISPECIES: hypothetical protein [Microbacterium]|uniref:hypothetical protein n=1 Tax=Microbacterium TaxID=33882 RepID=UPI00278BA23E|nr:MULTISPECIES: hypothetical protein [Microbacterium]MDQ1085201.1 hypothetical protein [Microbacterium sp. SORGH_AS_0344]MDQ1169493.1 hypothetical protein [Microbacterium proteolyticum]